MNNFAGIILAINPNFILGDPIVNSSWQVAEVTQVIALSGIALFSIFNIGIAIIRHFAGITSEVQLEKFFTSLVIFFVLLFYYPIITGIEYTVDSIEDGLRGMGDVSLTQVAMNHVYLRSSDPRVLQQIMNGASNPTNLIALSNNLYQASGYNFQGQINPTTNTTNQSTGNSTSQNATQAVPKEASSGGFFNFNIMDWVNDWLSRGICFCIRMIVSYLSAFLILFLIIVGPLAAMNQCAPWIGSGILKNWFGVFFSIKCWGITMAILDLLHSYFTNNFLNANLSSAYSSIMQISGTSWASAMSLQNPTTFIAQVVFIILYIATPILTTYYVRGSGAAMMSSFIAGGTTLVNVTSGAAQVGMAAASGGLSAVGSAATTIMGGNASQSLSIQQSMTQLAKSVDTLSKKMDK